VSDYFVPRGNPTILATCVEMIGMHATKDRPVVVDGQIVIRPIMIVALTYDHRLLDGREAVTFLGAWDPFVVLVHCPNNLLMELFLLSWEHTVRVKEYIEDPRKMLLA
jgi:2-oxoglutarate dehydrogenase E2 component (dihydrolipoamide succinyltransferase)